MADPEHEESHGEKPGENGAHKPGTPGTPDKKKDSKKQTIIAAASILGIVIAFMTFKKSSGGGGGATGLPAGGSIGAYTPAGNVAGAADNSSAYAGLQSMLGNLSLQLQQQESAIANLSPSGSSADTPTTTPPAFQFGQAAANDAYLVDYTNGLPNGALTGSVYQVQPNGAGGVNYYHLNPEEWSLTTAQQGFDATKIATLGAPPKK